MATDETLYFVPCPSEYRRLTDLDCDLDFQLSLHYLLGQTFVDHTKGSLAQLLDEADLVPWHLPLIWDVHWGTHIHARVIAAETRLSLHTLILGAMPINRQEKSLFNLNSYC